MRVRTLVSAAAAAVLVAGLTATPAAAGTGSSTWCNDGAGYREVPILTWPITLGVEISQAPGGAYHSIAVCYSTTGPGDRGVVTGGFVALDVGTGTGTASPGAFVGLFCVPDVHNGVAPACDATNSVAATPGDVVVSTPASSICLVSLGSGCVAYVPGVKVVTGGDSRPLLSVEIFGLPQAADVPPRCVAVVVTCP